jgi:hypothetical protein
MTATPPTDVRSLLRQAQAQQQLNRYKALRDASLARLVAQATQS